MLATFVHPNHIVYLCSWGLTHLPHTGNSKLFGYNIIIYLDYTNSCNTHTRKHLMLSSRRR
ncbi:hypothetical protein D3A87_17210 [Vibrio cholerae]|nr:hypothetical protein [Vibrio cholerae]MCD1209609.1 hypothetical protein [Vibrio cholerae]MCD1229693.1 hypothetical protein [Vibrio cholerae]